MRYALARRESERKLTRLRLFDPITSLPSQILFWEILSLAVEALRVCGLKDFSLRIGDLALFGALVDALALPPQWRLRLKRHFWRAGYVESLLYWLGHGDSAPRLPGSRAEIEALLDARADAPMAGRTREEIIARAMDRAAEAASLD